MHLPLLQDILILLGVFCISCFCATTLKTTLHFGTYAEYLSTKENSPIYLMPKNASFEEAAALIFGGQSAHYFLEKARLSQRSKPKVLIIGSTGSVGIAAIQIARYYKAEITAVCSSSSKALMKALRVENMIFYDWDDFIKTLFEKGEMKAIIDRTYSLEVIQQAHAYVDTGRKKGNVVIRVSELTKL